MAFNGPANKGKRDFFKDLTTLLFDNILTVTTITLGIVIYIQSQPTALPTEDSLALNFALFSVAISDYITRLKYFRKFRRDLDFLVKGEKYRYHVNSVGLPFYKKKWFFRCASDGRFIPNLGICLRCSINA